MKILIERFSSFGDVVLTTPIIKAIKEKYPEAIIDFIVYDVFSEGILNHPEIRNVVIFEKKNSKNKKYIDSMVERLSQEKYNFIIDLHSKFLSIIIGKKLSNKNTKYLRYKKRKWWKTLLVKAKLIPYNADCTIVESYFTALSKMGINFVEKYIKQGLGDNLEFYIDKKVEQEIVEKYNLKNRKYVVLAPGASKFTKKWPYYNELAQKILKNSDFDIFVVGGKEDFEKVEEDKEKRIINLCGKISFKESGVILKFSKLSVTNDSGPFHISRAVKAKTYVFFGPTDPKLFAFEDKTYLFYNEKCRPYSLYGEDKFPKKYADCMTEISVERVFNEIKKEF